MKKAPLSDRVRYAFDNTMRSGVMGLFAWLALITVAVVLMVSLAVWYGRMGTEASLGEQLWSYLAQTVKATPMTDKPWPLRIAQMVITYTGLFVTGAIFGILTSSINNKYTELRKGRSKVIENDHTVILGWSPKVFPIISDLLVANLSKPDARIVVLGNKDKVDMEDEITAKVGDPGNTRIVCRSGDPMEIADLEIPSLHTAKSIIILPSEGEDPDSGVIKTLMAIAKSRADSSRRYHIVAEIRQPKNLEVAHIVGREDAQLLSTGRLVARIMAQTCRQSGLPVVYTELLNFAGDEIYFKAEPGLVGKTFGEALLSYEDSAVMGLYSKDGNVTVNPSMTTVIEEGDQIIVLSEDDTTIKLSGLGETGVKEVAICTLPPRESPPERVLILGWSWRVPVIINELDEYSAPGSTVLAVADYADGAAEIAKKCATLRNQTVRFQRGDTTDRETLEGLGLDTCDHVVLLAYSDTLGTQEADARTLVTLLHLRDIAARRGYDFSIVSEMLDMRNRELAEIARADDFIVSDNLISLILSQVSENRHLGTVFADLFNPVGSEIYLKPVVDYVGLDEPVNFYTVVEAARRRDESALGYRCQADADDESKRYGVVLNPHKSDSIDFDEKDRVIVLATS